MDAEMPLVFEEKTVVARKPHVCCECRRQIATGQKYSRVKGCWDGRWSEFKTCLDCHDLRIELADPYYGQAPYGYLQDEAHSSGVSMPMVD